MTVLGASTEMTVITNSFIIAVNLIDKAKSKSLSPSDLIVVTLCMSNIFFQLVMLVTDYLNFICADILYTYEADILSTVLLLLPIYCSFWFTVCLSVNYYLQIVIATHPILIRLKFAAAQLVPRLIFASILISLATGLPSTLTFQRDSPYLNVSTNEIVQVSSNNGYLVYLLSSTLISCSLPLALVGIANGLIIKSLVVHPHKSDRNAKGELNAHAEGRVRAARTISCLLFIYISFYISEILVFMEIFPQNSPGYCVCLMVIYSYSPAQSIVLIFGSPKLKQVSLSFFHCAGGVSNEKPKKPTVLFIKLSMKKTVN